MTTKEQLHSHSMEKEETLLKLVASRLEKEVKRPLMRHFAQEGVILIGPIATIDECITKLKALASASQNKKDALEGESPFFCSDCGELGLPKSRQKKRSEEKK